MTFAVAMAYPTTTHLPVSPPPLAPLGPSRLLPLSPHHEMPPTPPPLPLRFPAGNSFRTIIAARADAGWRLLSSWFQFVSQMAYLAH